MAAVKRTVLRAELNGLIRAFSDALADRLEPYLQPEIELLGLERSHALRIHTLRRETMVRNRVDVAGMDRVLQRLAEPDRGETVWLFRLMTERETFVGFIDEPVSEVLGLVELPRNSEAEALRAS